ncbi:MAG: L-2-amino-thiazoline-4-carboxylic acid hydrolase [Thermodesulfobacteriota bacterium]|nr:L-2-amino-thiazoline-4-carboxylic acid hydrolase [Thermodesulfobacteriota bacterium]
MNIKNYGKPMSSTIREMPPWLRRKAMFISFKLMLKHLRVIGLVRFFLTLPGEWRRLMNHDYAVVCERGIVDQDFVNMQIQSTAMFSTMARVVGTEKALDIQTQIAGNIAYDLMSNLGPSPEELKATGDQFGAFRAWMKALYQADKEAGIHDYEIVEDTPDAFQVNVTYCAFYAIPAEVGLGIACQPSCYCDEIFFPRYCAQIGSCFKRESTIARGAKVCDFRFEHVAQGKTKKEVD